MYQARCLLYALVSAAIAGRGAPTTEWQAGSVAQWIYGLDLSIPVTRSVRRLTQVRDRTGADFTVIVVPELNHSWIPNGNICQTEGVDWDDGQVIVPWLQAHLPPW